VEGAGEDVRVGAFPDFVRVCQLYKKFSAAWSYSELR
jgi:hypothetical protein